VDNNEKDARDNTQKTLGGTECHFCSRRPDIVVRLEFTSSESVFDRRETTSYSQPLGFCFNCGHSFWEAVMDVIVRPIEEFLYSHPEENKEPDESGSEGE
jgi:hypothetical protein